MTIGTEKARLFGTDKRINQLMSITGHFLYIEYSDHYRTLSYKIENEYSYSGTEVLVLCPIDSGINRALDLAIRELTSAKKYFSKISQTVRQ